MSDQMVALKDPVLLFSSQPMMLVMQSNSSMAMTGRVALWKSVKTDSPDLSCRVVVALVVDEVASEADMVLVAVRVASAVAGEDLVVDMEVVAVEVLAVVDMVDLPLVATMLVAHRYLRTRSLTSQLPVRRKAKRFMFAMFVFQLFLHT